MTDDRADTTAPSRAGPAAPREGLFSGYDRGRFFDEVFDHDGTPRAHYRGVVERTFPMDLVPRIIPADEWATVEAGLVQRVTALNRLLEDL